MTRTTRTTSEPVKIPAAINIKAADIEFCRLPPAGERCPLTGLSRGALNNLILPMECNGFAPPVKSFVLRQKGCRTGVRIISYQSLRRWILANPESTGKRPEEGWADD